EKRSWTLAARLDIICTRTISTGRCCGRICVARYAKPESLDAALALLGDGRWQMLAGGTAFYPSLGGRDPVADILDINGIEALRGIRRTASGIAIGARTTWTELAR